MATARKRSATPSRSGSPAKGEKDPAGGLTAAGRAAFARKDGSHLKPGVTVSEAEMSPEDMKRKGSWAVRFYGRDPLPPLVDAKGEPTRFALSAHAWGEPVPKTEAAARKIAARGRKLLERHEAAKQKGQVRGEAKASGTSAKKAAAKRSTPSAPAGKKTASGERGAAAGAPAKKATAKKAPAKEAPAKKAPAKKAPAKKAPPTKASAKPVSSKKSAA